MNDLNHSLTSQKLHLKVNKWMLKLGFKWTRATQPDAHPFDGLWSKSGVAFTQAQAVFWYKTAKDSGWRRGYILGYILGFSAALIGLVIGITR